MLGYESDEEQVSLRTRDDEEQFSLRTSDVDMLLASLEFVSQSLRNQTHRFSLNLPDRPSSSRSSEDSAGPSDANDDAVTQSVYFAHDEAQGRLRRTFPATIEAVVQVVAEIFGRKTKPAPSGETGAHTPLWLEKVEQLDANFLDRLLVLTLARRLPQLVQTGETGLSYFDVPAASEVLANVRTLAQSLTKDLCDAVPAALLAGAALAPRTALAAVIEGVSSGLETHTWPGADSRYRELGNAMIEAVSKIDAMSCSAMRRTAIEDFYRNRST